MSDDVKAVFNPATGQTDNYFGGQGSAMSIEKINPTYHIPETFFKIIEPYVTGEEPRVFTRSSQLIDMWRGALSAYAAAPEHSEYIAEWAMSAAASSPLLADPRYDEIHVLFGRAEVEPDNEELWQGIEARVTALLQESAS